MNERKEDTMRSTSKLSVLIPSKKRVLQPIERLIALAEAKDRSVNHLVVEAILEYLDRKEQPEGDA